jgi:hypothetical protein
MLYEGNCGCDFSSDSVPNDGEVEFCWERKFSTDECADVQDGDDPRSFSLLQDVTTQIAALPAETFYPAIDDIVDFDAFLSMWAADALTNNWDGHVFHIPHNFRAYHDPSTGKWSVIPSGLDQTFSYVTDLGYDLVVAPFDPAALLAQRCLQQKECQDAFAARLDQATNLFESLDLTTLARSLEQEVEPYVVEDPRKEGSVDTFHQQVDAVVSFIASRPAEMRAALAERGYSL